MIALTLSFWEQLASGAGAVLAAALILAPGGAMLYHLRERRVVRVRGVSDWTAWAAALGLLVNLVALAATYQLGQAGVWSVSTSNGLTLADALRVSGLTFLPILVLVSLIATLVLRLLLLRIQTRRLEAGARAAAAELQGKEVPAASRTIAPEPVTAKLMSLLQAVQLLRGQGWRVRVTAGDGCQAEGVPIAVPVLGEDLAVVAEHDGVLLRIDDASLSFFAWSSLKRIEIVPPPVRVEQLTYSLVISRREESDLVMPLTPAPGSSHLECAQVVDETSASFTCALVAKRKGNPPTVLVSIEVSPSDWADLPVVEPATLRGSTSATIRVDDFRSRLEQLSASGSGVIKPGGAKPVQIVLRRIADSRLQIAALLIPTSD